MAYRVGRAEVIGTLKGEQLVAKPGILAEGVDSTGTANLVLGRDGVFYCTHWTRFGTGPTKNGQAKNCKHRDLHIAQHGRPVLATPEQVVGFSEAFAPKVEAPVVEAPKVEAKAKRGRPARSRVENERLALLLRYGQSKNEAQITLEGLKILGL